MVRLCRMRSDILVVIVPRTFGWHKSRKNHTAHTVVVFFSGFLHGLWFHRHYTTIAELLAQISQKNTFHFSEDPSILGVLIFPFAINYKMLYEMSYMLINKDKFENNAN